MLDAALLKPAGDLSAAFSGLVAAVAPSVVSVSSHGARSSGFVWRPGLIVTADEALADEGEINVTFADGTTVPATLAGRDATTDVALLRVDHAGARAVPLAAAVPTAGALAIAVGADQGTPAAAHGMVARVAGAWRSMRGGDIDQRIELDLDLRRKSEGGVVVDTAGQVYGMAVFGPRRRAIVIPAATIDRVAARLESHGRIARGYLGLSLQPVALPGAGGTGAMVISVDPKGPGALSGLHQGDIVISWNDERVPPMAVLQRWLGPDSVGKTVSLGISRAGAAQTLALTINERPAAQE